MIVNDELCALQVTDVSTPSPEGSIQEEEMVGAQCGEIMIREPPTLREWCEEGAAGAATGLLIIAVPVGRMSCIVRRRNLDEFGVRPVSITVINIADDAINR